MDDRVQVLLCALTGAGLFGLLGALFGAAAGARHRAGGRAAGGALGLAAARALVKARGRDLSDVATGAVVGGVDGLTFLGVVGTVVGLVYGYSGESRREMLLHLALGMGVLAAAAVVFGTLASGLIRGGMWGIAALFVAGLGGCVIGAKLAGVPGLVYGAVFGLGVGALVGLLGGGRRAPPSAEDEEGDEAE
jgi:hypothetical protein